MGDTTLSSRRAAFAATILFFAIGFFAAAAWADMPSVPADGKLKFKMFMSGRDIGHKTISFVEKDGLLQVDTEIDLKVRFAFLVVYTYEHKAREVWRGDRLQSLEAWTNDDGDKRDVRAVVDDDMIKMTSGSRVLRLPLDTFPSSYWNKALLRAKTAINSQLGEGIALETRALGNDTVMAHGKLIEAQRHKLIGREIRYGEVLPKPYLDIDLWYDEADVLVHMTFQYRGFEFVYVLD